MRRCPASCEKSSHTLSIDVRSPQLPKLQWHAEALIARAIAVPKSIKHRYETSSKFTMGKRMSIERHDTGPRMSKAVVHGNTVYLAGIVADAPKGKSTGDQTKDILRQIDGFLAKAGTDKSKLLSANIWITDMANFPEMNAVWDAWVAPGNTPARATVEAGLASPDYKVEIMVVAAK
jgi:enamine deaminase RidA (YjgF/YER057c/UK114 family)